jgi:hypothetical protein
MSVCDMCKPAKLDVQARPLLRVFDERTARTHDPFQGALRDYCCEKAQQLETPEHAWVLNEIKAVRQRRGIER